MQAGNEKSGYYSSPWPAEDGGAQRLQQVGQLPGLNIQPGESLVVKASRRLCTGNMMVLRDPGEVYLMHVDTLRDRIGLPCSAHIEKLNPETLEPINRSKALPGGKWWPGGFCVHRNGDLYVTFGRHMHRLDSECNLVGSLRLPQDLPYNSHVVLDAGVLVTKPIADSGQSQLCVIDPDGLGHVCPPITMPEPSISRLSATGNTVYVTGVRTIYRYHYDPSSRQLIHDEDWFLDYIGDSGQEYAWDPVITEDNIWFMDNGRHRMGRTSLSLLGAGVNPTPNRLIRVSATDSSDYSHTTIGEEKFGTITNPPLFCPQRNIALGFDSGNRLLRAWRFDPADASLQPLWSKPGFGIGGHTIYYADTGEVVTTDYQSLKTLRGLREGEHSAVLDIETGDERCRQPLGNYMQSAVFPAPAWGRGYYWLGLDKLSYVTVE